MNIERILKHRERAAEDQIIFNESLLKTDNFTGLIEKSVTSNLQSTALFLLKDQFENMELETIIEKLKQHIHIGDNYHLVESNPFITIYYDIQTRKGSN